MLRIGVQSHNIINDENPLEGFELLKSTGFDCVDFSLNMYLKNTQIYKGELNGFFRQSTEELFEYFKPHIDAAQKNGIIIYQMHMPYPIYVHAVDKAVNDFLLNEVALKSIELCSYMGCKYLVMHGIKLRRVVGSEEKEWKVMEQFIDKIAPLAIQRGVVLCMENLYEGYSDRMLEGPCCDAKLTKQRIDEINTSYGAEVLGFCFDTGHANLLGIDNEKYIKTLGKSLKVLHIHDNDGAADLHQIPFTFTKSRENSPSTDWEGFIKGLRAIDFDGVLNFETAPVLSAFPKELRGEVLKLIYGIGNYFSKQIGN